MMGTKCNDFEKMGRGTIGRGPVNRIPVKVVLAGTRFFDRQPPKKRYLVCLLTAGIVQKVPYVNRPQSSTIVDDGDHDFHPRTRG